MQEIKAAVIGLGFVGKTHFENLRRIPHIKIQAVVTTDEKKLKQYKNSFALPEAYTDWRELLKSSDIDVIHNCTPNYLHYEINKCFLKRGVDVVSEKPLTVRVEEAEQLVALASEKKTLNAVCFNYRFFPAVQQAKAMIDSGAIGKIRMLHGSYLQDWLFFQTDYNWKVEPRDGVLTRAVADIGSHWVDMAQFLTSNQVTEVMADLKTFIPYRRKSSNTGKEPTLLEMNTEDCASILLTIGEGIKANIIVSQIAAGRKNRFDIEINGSKGSLYWNQEEPNALWVGKRDEPNQVILDDPMVLARPEFFLYPGGHNEGWADAQKLLFDQIYRVKMGLAEETTIPTFADGLSAVKVEAAAFQSSQTKQWVSI